MDPFADTTDEVIAFNSQRDQNVISFVYLFPPSYRRIWNKSVSLIIDLLSHEGQGSLYSYLKEQGLIESIHPQEVATNRSVAHGFFLEFRLTDSGLKQWPMVSSVIFQYTRFACSQLKGKKEFLLFDE